MRPIYYRKGWLRVAETWFKGPEQRPDADVVRCVQVPAPVEHAACEKFHTLLVDLATNKVEMQAKLDRGTRYEVRRAETSDQLGYQRLPAHSLADIQAFLDAYTANLLSRDTTLKINLTKLARLTEQGLLDLSVIVDDERRKLTWHVHILDAGYARLLYSVSESAKSADQERRNLCGRANRLHHWLDMLRFKAMGCRYYDFGGFYVGTMDSKKLQINKFKKGFGGEVVLTYNCLYPLTFKGRLTLKAWRIFNKTEK